MKPVCVVSESHSVRELLAQSCFWPDNRVVVLSSRRLVPVHSTARTASMSGLSTQSSSGRLTSLR